jgi:CRP/FNR family cyclic AMP-dependent transcriptional regulator
MKQDLLQTQLPLETVLANAPWYALLTQSDQNLIRRTSSEKFVATGDFIVCAGDPPTFWMGVATGLVQMYVVSGDGRETILGCVGEGEWCGEGSLLKRERLRYDAIALQPTRIVLVSFETFLYLRATNIPFNHFLQDLMNARMSSFIETLVADRLLSPERRVASCIAALCRGKNEAKKVTLDIRQHELALICGLSRPRTNSALQVLAHKGYLQVEFRGLVVLDLTALNGFRLTSD